MSEKVTRGSGVTWGLRGSRGMMILLSIETCTSRVRTGAVLIPIRDVDPICTRQKVDAAQLRCTGIALPAQLRCAILDNRLH